MALTSRVLEIEEHALSAWPAAESEAVAGWCLRAMSGVSRRANSVWTGRATGTSSLEQRIAHAESFYRSRSLVPSFQISTHAQPSGLDAALAARGYQLVSPVSVQTALPGDVARASTSSNVRAEVEQRMSETWFELSARRGRFAQVEDVYRGLLTRLSTRASFAIAFIDDCPAAVGLGVGGARWFGISSMFTLPEFRGQGAARAVLRALAAHALERGETLYLQVERENQAALALYSSVGFTHHHTYHYRQAARESANG
ncbi:MAG TPA: GNAT family N-acetyltransferase [Polyangiaceae bacterium]|nr:GNAT family N-acetyltransferase [Polyangiaceae bacterium]